jgi:hypothetical protein
MAACRCYCDCAGVIAGSNARVCRRRCPALRLAILPMSARCDGKPLQKGHDIADKISARASSLLSSCASNSAGVRP